MDGHTRISEGVKKAKNMGQTALALTDHGNLSGIWKFVQTCQAEDIKPIPGMEAYLAIGDRHEKTRSVSPATTDNYTKNATNTSPC